MLVSRLSRPSSEARPAAYRIGSVPLMSRREALALYRRALRVAVSEAANGAWKDARTLGVATAATVFGIAGFVIPAVFEGEILAGCRNTVVALALVYAVLFADELFRYPATRLSDLSEEREAAQAEAIRVRAAREREGKDAERRLRDQEERLHGLHAEELARLEGVHRLLQTDVERLTSERDEALRREDATNARLQAYAAASVKLQDKSDLRDAELQRQLAELRKNAKEK